MEADGKRMTLEKEREPSNHQLGRKADVGAKDGIDLTAEDDSDIDWVASKSTLTRLHSYMSETRPIPYPLPRPRVTHKQRK
ncbi:hypothetical protein J1N35_037043 [Gossypium stocksii]|uniref:Uncharacterized protein n=1 Tax=Gossypium stocksii TaxID=47602 RepID=A0A9D3UL66_9ROSI|nr:hypothetical protein J1N35_037043 [Gossypium stocksii]